MDLLQLPVLVSSVRVLARLAALPVHTVLLLRPRLIVTDENSPLGISEKKSTRRLLLGKYIRGGPPFQEHFLNC